MPCPQSRWEDMGIQNFTDDKTNRSERTKAAVAKAIGMAMICVSQSDGSQNGRHDSSGTKSCVGSVSPIRKCISVVSSVVAAITNLHEECLIQNVTKASLYFPKGE